MVRRIALEWLGFCCAKMDWVWLRFKRFKQLVCQCIGFRTESSTEFADQPTNHLSIHLTNQPSNHTLSPLCIWQDKLKLKQQITSAYERAVRNCPWSSQLWVNYLHAMERQNTQFATMKGQSVPEGNHQIPVCLCGAGIYDHLFLMSSVELQSGHDWPAVKHMKHVQQTGPVCALRKQVCACCTCCAEVKGLFADWINTYIDYVSCARLFINVD